MPSTPNHPLNISRKNPVIEHQGQRLVYISEFDAIGGPFEELQKLREGNPHAVLFRDPNDKLSLTPAPETIRNALGKYGLTLADIGSSEEELNSLVERNARLQASEHLLRALTGLAWSLYNLEQFEKIRAFLKADYASFGTSEKEIKTCARNLHLAAAKVLLKEIQRPHRGDSFASTNPNPDNLARLEKHLAQANATCAALGLTASEWEAIKKQRLLYHAIWFVKMLHESLAFYEDPLLKNDIMAIGKPWHMPEKFLSLIHGLLAQTGETPQAIGLSEEDVQNLTRRAAFIRLEQNIDFLKDKQEDWKRKHIQAAVDEIRQDMATYAFTWEETGITRRQFNYHVQKWGAQ